MKNAKFWLVQIALVAIVSLMVSSPVLAGKGDVNRSDKAKGGIKVENSHANQNAYLIDTTSSTTTQICAEGTEGVYPDCTAVEEEDPPATGCASTEFDLYGDGSVCI
jgi:hypothetical protein